MTMHCQLEAIPGLEFLACQTTAPASNSTSHCPDSGCCSAEKSEYKSEQLRVSLPTPELLPMSSALLLTLANSLPDEVSVGILTAAPPQLLKTWQFASRTALPARAPSIAS
jgi:hypothetical protein